jgi:uncharacterized RDD family membrane protein YckC
MPTPVAAVAGWYPDPWQTGGERWWDGGAWTGQVRPWLPSTQRRVFGLAVDLVIALVIGGNTSQVVGLVTGATGTPDRDWTFLQGSSAILAIAVGVVGYFAVMYATAGASAGLLLGRMKVVDVDTETRLSWGRALARSLVLLVGVVIPLGWVIWFIVTENDPRRRGPHDRAGASVLARA